MFPFECRLGVNICWASKDVSARCTYFKGVRDHPKKVFLGSTTFSSAITPEFHPTVVVRRCRKP
jgi:hypothetical protein